MEKQQGKGRDPCMFYSNFKLKEKDYTFICNMKKELDKEEVCLLDLPEPVLESILERLSPAELCRLSKVCTSLRKRCSSDYLWKKHMERKWGRLISSDDWQVTDSIMVYCLSLESGKLWFPAQVFGQHGYAMSCYDAHVSYNHLSDNFQARYLPEGGWWWTSEAELPWDRLRKSPIIDKSDSITNELKPGDNIEICWSDIKEGSYGWWYGVIGHSSSCGRNVNLCRCQYSDKLIVEFKQYHIGSVYRRVVLNKKGYRETGNVIDGYYGDIRRLVDEEEITRWKNLWPPQNDPFQFMAYY